MSFLLTCPECERTVTLRGPLARVRYVLSSMTTCPCGGLHMALPSAASLPYSIEEVPDA